MRLYLLTTSWCIHVQKPKYLSSVRLFGVWCLEYKMRFQCCRIVIKIMWKKENATEPRAADLRTCGRVTTMFRDLMGCVLSYILINVIGITKITIFIT